MTAAPHQSIQPPAAPQAPLPQQRSWFRRHKFLTLALAVGAVAAIATSTGGGDDSPADGGATSAGLNDPVRDGKFEFVVKKVECGETEIGDKYLSTKAQGQFCQVAMSIENVGDEPQSLFGDNQKLFDAKGREFSADTEAAIYLDASSQTLWEEINPGNKVDGVVVFDVPKKLEPTRLELHDSAFSNGVQITL